MPTQPDTCGSSTSPSGKQTTCGPRGAGRLAAPRRRAIVASLILFLPGVIFLRLWMMGGVGALADDLIYYLPVRQYIGERIRAGEFPLWNPLTAMGTPVAADPQSGLWYPPTLLFVALPPLAAYCISLYLHFVLAGWGMYRWLRSLGREWRAALLGALAFELCGYLVAHRQHLTIHHAVAWIPWMFYAWQQFARLGRYRYAFLAVIALGLQLLVQHIQPSIIAIAILTAYVAIVLWPQRRSLIWEYPAGIVLGVMLAGVQIAPTWFHYASSGRGTPAYNLFIENSWVLSSGLLLLFPMLFGTPTPGVWEERWWGVSHLIEQWAYGSILMLLLAVASVRLLRIHAEASPTAARTSLAPRRWNREILFWWAASLLALLIAVGDLTPLSRLLFHVPVYRSLRVPARWVLVWSLAMPVLASAVVTCILSGTPRSREVTVFLKRLAKAMPVIAIGILLLLLLAAWRAESIASFSSSPHLKPLLEGLGRVIRPWNPAIWWPVALMIATAFLVIRWAHTRCPRLFILVFIVFLIDVASVAAFIDIDTQTYTKAELRERPALATAIRGLGAQPGDRLLVPRRRASYERPLEILWPQTNVQHDIATLNGYGPLWPVANRLLFRFMAWGASEDMLELLRNPALLRRMGVRFIAVRSAEERALLDASTWAALSNAAVSSIAGTQRMEPVGWEGGILWRVRGDAPGLYELSFDADPVEGSPSRWFVRLETVNHDEIGDDTRSIEPVDLSLGVRRMRFIFRCETPVGEALVRIKSEMGQALSAGRAAFGRIASNPSPADSSESPFVHRLDLESGISLYELPGTLPLVYWAGQAIRTDGLPTAVAKLTAPGSEAQATDSVFVENLPGTEVVPGAAQLNWTRPCTHQLQIDAKSDRGGVLAFNETYDSAWRATIDGKDGAVLRVNAVCMGIQLPPGEHVVRLQYWPRGLSAGIAMSAAAAGMILLLGSLRYGAGLRRRRQVSASLPTHPDGPPSDLLSGIDRIPPPGAS